MTSSPNTDHHIHALAVLTDTAAWVAEHAHLLTLNRIRVCDIASTRDVEIDISNNLTQLVGLLAAIPEATITSQVRSGSREYLLVTIEVITKASTSIQLAVYPDDVEATALAEHVGLAFPTNPRPNHGSVSLDALAAAAASVTSGEEFHPSEQEINHDGTS